MILLSQYMMLLFMIGAILLSERVLSFIIGHRPMHQKTYISYSKRSHYNTDADVYTTDIDAVPTLLLDNRSNYLAFRFIYTTPNTGST